MNDEMLTKKLAIQHAELMNLNCSDFFVVGITHIL